MEAFEIFSQERDLDSCGDVSLEDPLEKHKDMSKCELDSCAHVRVVLDVIDVFSPSSVVIEFCEASCCSDLGRCCTAVLLLQKIVHIVVQIRRKRRGTKVHKGKRSR